MPVCMTCPNRLPALAGQHGTICRPLAISRYSAPQAVQPAGRCIGLVLLWLELAAISPCPHAKTVTALRPRCSPQRGYACSTRAAPAALPRHELEGQLGVPRRVRLAFQRLDETLRQRGHQLTGIEAKAA